MFVMSAIFCDERLMSLIVATTRSTARPPFSAASAAVLTTEFARAAWSAFC
jgi:hypothetical protein